MKYFKRMVWSVLVVTLTVSGMAFAGWGNKQGMQTGGQKGTCFRL
jgi:hypothetical protein